MAPVDETEQNKETSESNDSVIRSQLEFNTVLPKTGSLIPKQVTFGEEPIRIVGAGVPYVANSTFFDEVNGTHEKFLRNQGGGKESFGGDTVTSNAKRSSFKSHGLLVNNSTSFPRNRSTLIMHKPTALSTHLNARASMKRPTGFYKYRSMAMFNTTESLPN